MPIDTKAIRNNWTVAVGPLRGADSTGTILALCDEVDRLTEALSAISSAHEPYKDGDAGIILCCGWDNCPAFEKWDNTTREHANDCPIGIADRAMKDNP